MIKLKKYLNNQDFLDILYDKYHIEAGDFTTFIKKYNESLLYYDPQLYLYQMESTLLLPDQEYLFKGDTNKKNVTIYF